VPKQVLTNGHCARTTAQRSKNWSFPHSAKTLASQIKTNVSLCVARRLAAWNAVPLLFGRHAACSNLRSTHQRRPAMHAHLPVRETPKQRLEHIAAVSRPFRWDVRAPNYLIAVSLLFLLAILVAIAVVGGTLGSEIVGEYARTIVEWAWPGTAP
jgi:hypothetical protein